jgi:hypothetical protein
MKISRDKIMSRKLKKDRAISILAPLQNAFLL